MKIHSLRVSLAIPLGHHLEVKVIKNVRLIMKSEKREKQRKVLMHRIVRILQAVLPTLTARRRMQGTTTMGDIMGMRNLQKKRNVRKRKRKKSLRRKLDFSGGYSVRVIQTLQS